MTTRKLIISDEDKKQNRILRAWLSVHYSLGIADYEQWIDELLLLDQEGM